MVQIAAIREEHVEGFHSALDRVARERKYLNRFEAPPIQSTREFVLRNIREGVAQFVALDRGTVVGWCDVSPDRHPATAHSGYLGIGLLPEYRGQGIGRRLISAALRRAKENGLERVHLTVNSSNDRARSLYEKVGFRLEGVMRRAAKFDGRYEDELMMALLLDDIDPQSGGVENTMAARSSGKRRQAMWLGSWRCGRSIWTTTPVTRPAVSGVRIRKRGSAPTCASR